MENTSLLEYPRADASGASALIDEPVSLRETTPREQPAISSAELLAQLRHPVEPVKLPARYVLALLVTAIAMVLLPLLYVALIGLTAYGLWYHMVENVTLMATLGARLGLLIYATPLVAGGIGLVFMIKPLFAPSARHSASEGLSREDQPLLFNFVDQLCDCVGAPRPSRIIVSTDVNASASLGGSLCDLLGRNPQLTIGLPLVAGLDLQQFTGVLAHEFGHFAQGAAMRLTFIIDTVNNWFARVVYQRDAWDEWLVRTSSAAHGIVECVMLYLARFFICSSRWILWCFMVVGRLISNYMSRQMEFDADRYHARVAGSDSVAPTHVSIHLLDSAHSYAFHDLQLSWHEGRLCDDLPALVMANLTQMQEHEEAMRDFEQSLFETETGWLDTHPATRERVENAVRENAPGIIHAEMPARALFRDFEQVCRTATLAYYNDVLEEPVCGENLVPTATIASEQIELNKAYEGFLRYFQGSFLGVDDEFPGGRQPAPPADGKAAFKRLFETREAFLAERQAKAGQLRNYYRCRERADLMGQGRLLMQAGLEIDTEHFELAVGTRAEVDIEYHGATAAAHFAQGEINQLKELALERLDAALRFLFVPEMVKQFDGADETAARLSLCQETLAGLQTVWPTVIRLREFGAELNLLLHAFPGNEHNSQLTEMIEHRAEETSRIMADLYERLTPLAYPFEHARQDVSLAQFAVDELPPADDVCQVLSVAAEMIEKLNLLYRRLFSQLAVIAEQVETTAGFAPLPDPPDEEEEAHEVVTEMQT